MIDYRNPVVFLRKVQQTVVGIKKIEEWRIYFAVALLCIVISMTFLLYSVDTVDQQGTMRQSPPQHLTLPFEQIEVKVSAVPRPPQEEVKTEAVKPVATESEPEPETEPGEEAGQWYYSDVHKDWRYRKIK